MNPFYAGRTVLVTGAAAGIGRAIARLAAANGASVVLGDVAVEALVATRDEIRRAGGRADCRACDVRELADIVELVELAVARFGLPDAVFANAGVEGKIGELWDCSEAEFARIFDINVMGAWRTLKTVLPKMVARGSGAVVATASVAGLVGAAGLTAYVASKHAVVGLVRSAAVSVARSGVRVNALCPGMIDTAMVERLGADVPNFREAILAMTPMGRLGKADEVAAAALWLGGDQSGFVTGHALAMDGGFLAQ